MGVLEGENFVSINLRGGQWLLTELFLAVEPEVPRDDDELADQGYPEQRRRDRAP